MNKSGNYISEKAAIDNVATFFSTTSINSGTVSVEEVFIAAGRDPSRELQNKSWLANKLTSMKDYGLITKHYSKRGGRKKLTKLSLTSKGRKVLGRPDDDIEPTPSQTVMPTQTSSYTISEVTPESVYQAVKILREQMPSFNIVFEIKPKEESPISFIYNSR